MAPSCRAMNVAATVSLRPSVIAPSVLSGARTQTSTASTSFAPAAMRCAAVTSTGAVAGRQITAPRYSERLRSEGTDTAHDVVPKTHEAGGGTPSDAEPQYFLPHS